MHGILATSSVWRDFAEMEANTPVAMCFQEALPAWAAFVFCYLFPSIGVKKELILGCFLACLPGS